jgi:hypothetical protein
LTSRRFEERVEEMVGEGWGVEKHSPEEREKVGLVFFAVTKDCCDSRCSGCL